MPHISEKEFSMAFEASYNKSSETTKKAIKEILEDVEGTEEMEEGLPWFVWMQHSDEKIELPDNFGESVLLENFQAEETSLVDASTETLQLNPSNERLINTTEIEALSRADIKMEEVSTETKVTATEEGTNHQMVETLSTVAKNLTSEKSVEHQSLTTLLDSKEGQQSTEVPTDKELTENMKALFSEKTINNHTDQQVGRIPKDSGPMDNEKTLVETKEWVEPLNQNESTRLMDKGLETQSIPAPKTEEIDIQEQRTNAVIEDVELEGSFDEKMQPRFERGIEQLRNMRVVEPQVKSQEMVKISETEWVNKVETVIVEQMDAPNTVEKTSTARIQLTPKHLGEMEIELTLKDKGLTARLVVEQMETKEWLEHKMAELTTKLAKQNIEVTDVQISIAKNEQDFVNTSAQDNPFFKEKEQQNSQKKSQNYILNEEQIAETNEQKYDTNTGRLSIWV